MILEVEEQRSDNGLDDIVADQHAALSFYEAALQAIPFPEEEEEEKEPEAFDEAFAARMLQMELGKDGSDDEQGSDSGESYGKEESETAPSWV